MIRVTCQPQALPDIFLRGSLGPGSNMFPHPSFLPGGWWAVDKGELMLIKASGPLLSPADWTADQCSKFSAVQFSALRANKKDTTNLSIHSFTHPYMRISD